MREQALRASSSYPDRAEYRQGQGNGRAKSSGTRSRRSANLSNLARELGGQDLLGAALGLTNEAVTILVDGRDHARENQYGAHLAARLKDAGIPASWLDQTNAKISPDYLSALRKFAAASSNKAPIRRANFRRIAAAFEGREQVLADALEMVASAIPNVVDGLLELDDGRFGHMNPRLMRAGFPDSWLEEAEPDLTDALLLSLEQLATDEYERHFEAEDQAAQAAHAAHEGQAFVAPTPEPSPTVQPTAAPVDKPKETVMAPKPQSTPLSLPPQQPEFKAGGMPSAAAKPMAHPSAAGPRVNRNLLAAGRSVSGPAAKPIGSVPAKSISRAAPPPKQPMLPGQPPVEATGAAAAAQAPVASNQAPAAPTPLASSQVASAPAAAPTVAPTTGAAAPSDAPAAPQSTQAAAPGGKPASTTAPRGTVSKEVSMRRSDALEKLLENSRRGAKVTLWRDIVGSSLPFWGNIRRGAVLFRDDLAQAVEKALELPEGWLDNATFPPASIAAWLTDEKVPLPQGTNAGQGDDEGGSADQGADGSAAQAAAAPAPAAASVSKKGAGSKKGSQPKRDVARPFATNRAPQPPRVTMAGQPPALPPALPGTDATPAVDERQLQLVDMGAPAPGMTLAGTSQSGLEAQGAQAPAVATTPSVPAAPTAPAPVAGPAVAAAAPPAPVATIAPAVAPIGQAGPLTQALVSIITAKSAAGTFTETDALALINQLMGT